MSEYTLAESHVRSNGDEIASALTLEFGFYVALASIALFVRFFLLDAVPLNSAEARQALASWDFVRGNASTVTGSPLLFTANALFFSLFGASDFASRIAPAFIGTILVLSPALYRRELGRVGALLASALLAISPSLVLFSRTLDGVVIAAACSLAAIAFLARYLETRAARDLYWVAASAALALISAPDVWTVVLALVLYAIALRFIQGKVMNPPEELQDRRVGGLVVFLLVLIGASTTFLLHRDGIGASFDLLASWFDSLRLGNSFGGTARLLLVYEPLVLFFGLAALYDLVFSIAKNRFTVLGALGFWVAVAFLLLSFSADNRPSRIVIVVVPLALLAGSGIGSRLERLAGIVSASSSKDLLMHEVPILAIAAGLMSFLTIVLAELAQRGNVLTADVLARLFASTNSDTGVLVVALLFLVAFFATSVLAVATLGVSRAKNVGLFFALVVLCLWNVRQMTMVNFPAGGALNPQEWIVTHAASPNVRDLTGDLEDASRWRANDTHTLAIEADDSLGPIVAWSLRDFVNVRYLPHPAVAPNVQALLLAANSSAPSGSWIMQRYQLELTHDEAGISPLRGFIFRDVGNLGSMDAILWLPSPQ